ncbi:MAG TPA: FAD:protein FMN transferase [Candidatus Thioglobus sp.]|nr:FAD:protein FMN transferase [Candidatus Thioglobus sp.]
MPKILSLCLIFLLTSCSNDATLRQIDGKTMGTTYSVKVVSGSELRVTKEEIDERLKEINKVFSNWDPYSELSLLDSEPVNEWVQASDELIFVLNESKKIMHKTAGAFDPGIGRVIDVWGFGPRRVDVMPDRNEIEDAVRLSSLTNLVIGNTKIKKTVDIHINLSAIAKGYAVDEIAELLKRKGITDFLVEIGGEVVALGKNIEQQWTVGIEMPNSESAIPITLNNKAIATSGNYRNFFIWEGEKYNHIIEPGTGLPVRSDLASVSVIHPQTMIADAYATAMMVMGSERSIVLAKQLDLSIILILNGDQGYKQIKINL